MVEKRAIVAGEQFDGPSRYRETSVGVLTACGQHAVPQQHTSSQQTDQPQQQLLQLKPRCEVTPRELEQRVGALEQQTERVRE